MDLPSVPGALVKTDGWQLRPTRKAAGGILTAKQAPAGPAPPRRSVCAPAAMSRHCIADQPGKGERTMSFHSWLQNLRSALAPRRGQRQHRRRASPRAATLRPNVELLEDRLTPSLTSAGEFLVGPIPQAVVTADFNNDGRLDLATANIDPTTVTGSVSVLLGDGLGG